MCDCVLPSQVFGENIASEWLNQDGRVVHPAAPQGGGGGGGFKLPGTLNFRADTDLLPHPQSPAAPGLDPARIDQAEQLQAQAGAAKPPPKVTTQQKSTVGKLEIVIEPDGQGDTSLPGAVTKPVLSHSGSMRKLETPDKSTVVDFKNEKQFKVTIQTIYQSGKPEMPSKYGRGKTVKDLADGNISLGFHESCHRADLLAFFTNKAQPVFAGQKNSSQKDFQAAFDAYLKAWQDMVAEAEKDSLDKTDEVDPKKSAVSP